MINADSNLLARQVSTQEKNSASPEFEKLPKKPKREYNDPLMKWPIRGMAFTNDIGAAIMDIAPTAGQALWIPALMYFGADIYDKYRNDKAEYDPSAKRGLKQAIFQSLASVIFPVAVVHAGQKTASFLYRASKDGVSLQTKEEVIRHHLNNISQVKLTDYENDIASYKKEYHATLDTMIDETTRRYKYKNPLKAVWDIIFGSRHPEAMGKDTRENIHTLIDKHIDDMFTLRKALLEGNSKPEGLPDKLYKKFLNLKETYKNDPKYASKYAKHAAKDVIKTIEEGKIFKTKLLKTIGGFIALGLLIKPMDGFVENVIMHKYVGPGLDKLDNSELLKSKKNFLDA